VSLFEGPAIGDPLMTTLTSGAGEYEFQGLNAAMNYRIVFEPDCGAPADEYPTTYYLNEVAPGEADTVAVTLGGTATANQTLYRTPIVALQNPDLGPTNDQTPSLGFTAIHATSVECAVTTGPPEPGDFGVCSGGAVHQVSSTLPEGTYTFTVRASNPLESAQDSGEFIVDITAPVLTFAQGPNGPTNDNTPTFDVNPDANVECSLDQGTPDFEFCDDGILDVTTPLADGTYTFRARATDAAGNLSALVTREFTVDTVAPTVEIVDGPTGSTDDTSPTFVFTAAGGGTVECSVDGGTAAFGPCSGASSHTASALAPGAYTFRVRTTDAAGNAATATRSFSVTDSSAPTATITGGPKGKTKDKTPTFSFTSSEPNSTFRCKMDSGAEQPCSSPFTSKKLKAGKHTFSVVAVDAAGNASAPATQAFKVKKKKKRR
jgi:hypothetical protein